MKFSCLRLGHGFNAVLISFACLLEPEPARATTLWSTKLSFTAEISTAVVQGIVQRTENLVDIDGVPWTLYSLEVQKVLAGDVTDTILGIRCVGGTAKDGTATAVAGFPQLRVGDNIIAFLTTGSLCQVSGLEYGVYWQRRDAAGVDRLVDFRGRVLAAVGGDDVVLSGEVVAPEKLPEVPEVRTTTNAENETWPPPELVPPPGDATTLIAELEAFASAYVTRPGVLASTKDLTGAPSLRPPTTRSKEATR